MNLDSSVIVVKNDGSRVLTSTPQPSDDLLGTTYAEVVEASQIAVDPNHGWTRTDAEHVHPIAPAPVVDSVLHLDRPAEDASKRTWWRYAQSLGYGSTDYEHTSKQDLIDLYGTVDPKGAIGA